MLDNITVSSQFFVVSRTVRHVILAMTMGLLSLFSGIAQAEDGITFFRIGAGPTSETLYALSTAISASISLPPGTLPCNTLGGVCGVPGLIAVAQSKSGSIENLIDLRNGEVDSAMVRADIANQAFKGIGPFIHDTPNEELRIIANMMPVTAHIVVRQDSDIHTISDLVGQRVSIGAKGSGTKFLASSIMQSYGHDINQVIYKHLRPGPASDGLFNKTLDAAIIVGAAPIAPLEALSQKTPLRFLEIKGTARETLKRIYAHINDGRIEGYFYNEERGIETVGIDVQWVVSSFADTDLIKDITQALWQSETENFFIRNNPEHYFPIKESATAKGLIPIHPGAKIYYKSVNLLK